MEPDSGRCLESQAWEAEELDHTHTNLFRVRHDLSRWPSQGDDGRSRCERWLRGLVIHLVVVLSGLLVRHARYCCRWLGPDPPFTS